ncbi:MAG: TIGR02646 family protein [Thermoguttaceae bacterium]|nr:TIGR02646 family protein [Thermoguttaceae bacterium]
MHKFERGEEPEGLKKARKQKRSWDEFVRTPAHIELAECLYERQERCCAYCDMTIKSIKDGHIEHLERRSNAPKRALDWGNLFFSCQRKDSCGKYKDSEISGAIDSRLVVDPSQEDPLDYFSYAETGEMVVVKRNDEKAETTIKVFNLNTQRLKNARSRAYRNAIVFLKNYDNLGENPPKEAVEEFLNDWREEEFFSSVFRYILKR